MNNLFTLPTDAIPDIFLLKSGGTVTGFITGTITNANTAINYSSSGSIASALESKVDKYQTSKTYTNDYAGTVTASGNCTNYDREFAQVIPDDYNQPWMIRLVIKNDMYYNNTTHYKTYHSVEIGCQANSGTTWYKNYNIIQNTSYLSNQYIVVYRPATSTKAASAPFRVCFRAGSQPSASANPRTHEVYLVEAIGCTCTLNDSLDNTVYQKYYYNDHSSNAYYWSATSGGSFYSTAFDVATNGLQETGDLDSKAYNVLNYSMKLKAGTNKLFPYTIAMCDNSGNYQSLVTSYAAGTTKSANTSSFRLDKPIFFYNASSTIASGSIISDNSMYYLHYKVSAVYSFNCGSTLTVNKPLYIVGTVNSSTGLFTLDTTKWYSQDEPSTEDGKVYIFTGIASGTNTFSLDTKGSVPIWYKNGGVRKYPETGVSFGTSESSTLSGALQKTGGTMSGGLKEATGTTSGTSPTINLNSGNCFTHTVTGTTTFTFSNPGPCSCFSLVLTNAGAYTINWPNSVLWASGTPPTLTSSGVDVLTFITPNGGTNWYGNAFAINASVPTA